MLYVFFLQMPLDYLRNPLFRELLKRGSEALEMRLLVELRDVVPGSCLLPGSEVRVRRGPRYPWSAQRDLPRGGLALPRGHLGPRARRGQPREGVAAEGALLRAEPAEGVATR